MINVGPVQLEEARIFAGDKSIPWECYAGKTVAITGATGLIGSSLVATLAAHNELCEATPIHIIALVRNEGRAQRVFEGLDCPELEICHWDASDKSSEVCIAGKIDYMIHAACPTDSKSFAERPIETIEIIFNGTKNVLSTAVANDATLCFLSTMEVYGQVDRHEPISETALGLLDPMVARNSYPEAKRLAEAMCASYSKEYGAYTTVARLAQTFGPGVRQDDRRVFAEFARNCINGEDIVLLTDGKKCNSYLYTFDAVTAILTIAAKGECGTAYNVANDETVCTIKEMAQIVAESLGMGKTRVLTRIDNNAAKKFRNGDYLVLDTARLRALGWNPQTCLEIMYSKMVLEWMAR